eukprot:gene26540-35207_t
MYNLLSQYPDSKLAAMKENCAFIHDRNLVQYFDSLPAYIEPGQIAIDGCIDLRGNMKLRKILKNPRTFYLVLFRDFADWLWSAYNFWCEYNYDSHCCDIDPALKKCADVGYWVDPVAHHRSPGTFHDIINGAMNGTHVPSPMVGYLQNPCEHGKHFTQRFVEELWAEVPLENTLFVASELLDKYPFDVWQKVARRIGLRKTHPKMKDFASVRYNSQVSKKSRGVENTVSKKGFVVGLYLVSGFQPQLNVTRAILNTCWAQDCALASLITGYRYRTCSGSTIESVDVKVRSQLQRYLDFDGDESQPSFFAAVTHHCQASIIAARDRNQHILGSLIAPVIPELAHVLIISNYEEDRIFLLKLLFFSTGLSNFIDADDSRGELCGMAVDGIAGHQPIVVGTHASNIQKTERGWKIIHSNNKCTNGGSIAMRKPLLFTRMVVVTRDPVTSAWTQYQSSIGVAKVVDETLLVIDWEQWERYAVRKLANSSTNADHIRLNDVWKSAGIVSDKLIIRIEDIRYSSSRGKTLHSILQFIARESNITDDNLRCAYLLLTANSSAIAPSTALQTAWYSSRSTLAIAYASSQLICQIVHLFAGNSVLMSSLSLPSSPDFKTVNDSSESRSAFQQKCRVRYKLRIYAPSVRVYPAALIAMPGPEAVHVRLLIEHSIGIYSGSIVTDHTLTSVLPGEAFCGKRMSIIHASPLEGTFKFLRTGEGVISMSKASIVKCMRGYIRGLVKGLLVVKDPIYYVWEKYWRNNNVFNLLSVGRILSNLSPEEESRMVRGLVAISSNYSVDLLSPGNAFRSLKIYLRSHNAMVVTYESLVHGESQRTKVLRSVLEFIQYNNVLPERLRCSYTFLELLNVERRIALMHGFFIARRSVLCLVYTNIYKAIKPTSFNFTRLYSEEKC